MEERVEMTNEQMWTLIEMVRSILRMAATKEEAEAELDRIIETTKTQKPKTPNQ